MTKHARMTLRSGSGLVVALLLLASSIGCDLLNPPATPAPPTPASLPAGITVVPLTSTPTRRASLTYPPTTSYAATITATLTTPTPISNPTLSPTPPLAVTAVTPASVPASVTIAVSASSSLSVTATPSPTPLPPPPSSTQFLYVTSGGTLHLRDASGKQDVTVSPGAALGKVDDINDFAAFHLISWSPDGKLLTYANSVVGGMDIVDVDKAASAGADNVALHIEATGPNDAAWSSDGRYLAISQRAGDEQGYQLNIVDTQSGLALTGLPDVEVRDMAWSPANDTLAYSVALPGGSPPFGEVYTVTVSGTQSGPALRVAADGENPQWSPDGRLLTWWQVLDNGGDHYDFRVMVHDSVSGKTNDLGQWSSDDAPDFAPFKLSDGYIYHNMKLASDGARKTMLWPAGNRILAWAPAAGHGHDIVALMSGTWQSNSRLLSYATLPGAAQYNLYIAHGDIAQTFAPGFDVAWSRLGDYLAFTARESDAQGNGLMRAYIQPLSGGRAISLGDHLLLGGWGASETGESLLVQSEDNDNFFLTGPDFKLRQVGQGVAIGWRPR